MALTLTTPNSRRLRQYLDAIAAMGAFDEVAAFVAPDATFHELPNRIAPLGRVRRAADLRDAFAQGRQLLSSQAYEIQRLVEAGDDVAAEVEWTGTLAQPFANLPVGHVMKAYVGLFITFRDGRIVSQRNYDCYPPFTAAG